MSEKKHTVKKINNFEIHESDNYLVVNLNLRIFSIDVIFSAMYIFMDKSYLVITGDPTKEVFIEIRPKEKNVDLEELGRNFNNELLNYAVYFMQSERNKEVKNTIIKKALFSNDSSCQNENAASEAKDEAYPGYNGDSGVQDGNEFDNLSYKDDPLGISKSWDEKEN
jgi:His-Xaa-Ser system protein HxsD